MEKAPQRRQVSVEKMSASEPLMTRRKDQTCCQNGGRPVAPGLVWKLPVYCPGGRRRLGVHDLNTGSDEEHGNLAVDAKANDKWEIPTRKNTDATDRGGAAHSSEEGAVMDLERRSGIIQTGPRRQPAVQGGTV
jgi:hypothetical protein